MVTFLIGDFVNMLFGEPLKLSLFHISMGDTLRKVLLVLRYQNKWLFLRKKGRKKENKQK